MATSKVLQTPTILSIDGSTIRVSHPDLSRFTKTEMVSPLSAAGTTLTVADNNNFADDDWFILGVVGDAKTEECDVNGAPTRGQTLTITNSTKFAHEIHTPVTKILERKIKIYGAATDGGSGTLIASIDAIVGDAFSIQWNRPYSEYTLITSDTVYAYYYAVYTDGVTDSPSSDYVAAAGLLYNSAAEVVRQGLLEARASVDGRLITNEWLLAVINDCEDEVLRYTDENGVPKDWSFEVAEDISSLIAVQNLEKYSLSSLSPDLKYPNSEQGIISVKLGTKKLTFADLDEIEKVYEDKIRTEVATQQTAGQTTLVLDDVSELSDAGSIWAGSQSLTYTGRNTSTNTLTGIPASGAGSITATIPVDTVVWQGITPGIASKYTVFNGYLLLDAPVQSSIVGQKIKIRYSANRGRKSSLSDTMVVTPLYYLKYYVAARIESRKTNQSNSDRLMKLFRDRLADEAAKDRSHIEEQLEYYHMRSEH